MWMQSLRMWESEMPKGVGYGKKKPMKNGKKRKNGKKKKSNGLTAKQRKLPPALQRAILRKKRGKKS